jgi:hypothetical protein
MALPSPICYEPFSAALRHDNKGIGQHDPPSLARPGYERWGKEKACRDYGSDGSDNQAFGKTFKLWVKTLACGESDFTDATARTASEFECYWRRVSCVGITGNDKLFSLVHMEGAN